MKTIVFRNGFVKSFLRFFSCVIAVSLFSCEVGLGPAVDINPPTLEVTYPPSFSNVRGKFWIAGKASDDTGVQSVTVTVKNVQDETPPITKSATIENGVWWIDFNEYDTDFNPVTRKTASTDPEKKAREKYNGWKLPDGKYQAEVLAKDIAGRDTKTTSPLSFSIDNTPPFLLVSRLLSKGEDEKKTRYGQTIQLQGALEDASKCDELTFYVQEFEEPANLLGTPKSFSIKDPRLTDGNPLTIARFYTQSYLTGITNAADKAIFTKYRDTYTALYGKPANNDDYDASEKKDKYFYACFVVKDKARYFDNPPGVPSGKIPQRQSENVGNTTTKYYLKTDEIESDLFSSQKTKFSSLELGSEKVSNIVAGIESKANDDNNGNGTPDRDEILTRLDKKENYVQTEFDNTNGVLKTTESSKFTLNPDVSPTYESASLNNIDDTGIPQKNYSMGPITFQLVSGADLGTIKADTIEITVYKLDADKRKTGNQDDTFILLKKGNSENTSGTPLIETIDLANKVQGSQGFLRKDNFYWVEITGEDTDGNRLVPKDGGRLGFVYGEVAVAPEVSFDTPDQDNTAVYNHEYKKGESKKIVLEGTAKASRGLRVFDPTNHKAPVVLEDMLNGSVAGTYYVDVDRTTNKWRLELQALKEGAQANDKTIAEGKHTFKATAWDIGNLPSSVSRTFTVDITAPSWKKTENGVTVDTTPKPKKEATWYKEQSLQISAKAYDDAFSGVAKILYGSKTDGAGNIIWNETGNNDFSVTLDEGENTIRIKAVDIAGNETDEILVFAKLDTKPPVLINLKLENESIKGKSVLTNKKKDVALTFTAKDFQIGTVPVSGVVSDASGQHPLPVMLSDNGAVIATAAKTANPDEYSITIPKDKIKEGAVQLKITDNAGNEKTETAFSFRVDETPPDVAVKSPIENATVNKTITVSGSVYDNFETPEKVFLSWKTSNSPEAYSAPKEVTQTNGTWTCDFDTVSETFIDADGNAANGMQLELRIQATDKAGNPNEAKRVVTVDQDTDRPVIKFENMKLRADMSANDRCYIKLTHDIEGSIKDDDNDLSGNVEFYFRKPDDATPDPNDWTEWKEVTVQDDFTWKITGLPEGDVNLQFKIKDKAGTEFYTDASGHPQGIKPYPKFTDMQGTKLDASDTLFSLVNTQSPDTKDETYEVFNGEANPTRWEAYDKMLGGVYTKIRPSIWAKDANGIEKAIAYIADQNGTPLLPEVELTVDTAAGISDGYTKYKNDDGIDISSMHTELTGASYKLIVAVRDKAELDKKIEKNVFIDNAKPTVTINNNGGANPKEYAGTIVGAVSMFGTANEVSVVSFALSDSEDHEPKNDPVPNVSTAWQKADGDNQTISWQLGFDDGVGGKHTDNLVSFIKKLGIKDSTGVPVTDAAINAGTAKDCALYLWIQGRDKVGNKGTEKIKLYVDPLGDRPTVKLVSPKDGDRTGGAIQLFGSAKDNIIPKYVWLQIDKDYGQDTGSGPNTDFTFDKADIDYLRDKGYTVSDMKNPNDPASFDGSNWAENAIRIPTSGSWNFIINEKGEFNPGAGVTGATSSTERKLMIRLWATDEDTPGTYHRSTRAADYVITIDNASPIIKNAHLVQYEDVALTSEKARKEYQEGDSIKGSWYLVVDIIDSDAGIKKITKTVDGRTDVIDILGTETAEFTKIKDENTGNPLSPVATYKGSDTYNYTARIKVGSDVPEKVGTSTVVLVATEATDENKKAEKTFSLKYDNKVPVLIGEGDERYKLPKGSDKSVFNSNGFYTFGSVAKEEVQNGTEQSGIDKIAFYFVRGETIYDPMQVKKYNKQSVTGLTKSEGLYWKPLTASKIEGAAITVQGSLPNDFHVGLVKVRDVIYTVKNKAGNTIELYSQLKTASDVPFEYALALAVNNQGESGGGSRTNEGYYETVKLDDNDSMVENLTAKGTDYFWEANINSNNIPDGPVTLHYVAFDKAGNYAEGKVENCFVKNNAPRIAGLKIGTDDNGNGKIDGNKDDTKNNGEWIMYHDVYQNNTYDNKAASAARFPNYKDDKPATHKSVITVKGFTKAIPEIVGGNGALSYAFDVAQYDGTNNKWQSAYVIGKSGQSASLGNANNYDEFGEYKNDVITPEIVMDVKSLAGNGIQNGEKQKFSFTINDSTEGTAQKATMDVIMNVDAIDDKKPHVYIVPFYWNSETKNSLFENKRENGHIELQGGFPGATDTAGVNDKDAKVSGKIKIEGIAHDNIVLSELSLSFEGFAPLKTKTKIASYDAVSGTWKPESELKSTGEIPTEGWACTVEQATYGDYKRFTEATGQSYAIPEELTSDNSVPYFSQDKGHVVHWTVYIDTEKGESIAALDKTVRVSAKDKGKPSLNGSILSYAANDSEAAASGNTGGDDGSGKLTAINRVDIVPFITDVVTGLSNADGGVKGAFSRASTGEYPVRIGSSITVEGFNLEGGKVWLKGLELGAVRAPITVPAAATSGELSVKVGGIDSINNAVNQEAPYNNEGNAVSNDTLTVARKLFVWKMEAVLDTNAMESPQFVMAPDSTKYLVFGNLKSFPGSNTGMRLSTLKNGTQSDNWESCYSKYHNTAIAYDKSGNMYLVATNTDRTSNSTSMTFFSQKESVRINSSFPLSDNYERAYNKRRLENASCGAVYDVTRVAIPKLAVKGGGTPSDPAKVALVYYDRTADTHPLKFRYGKITAPDAITGGLNSNIESNIAGSVDGYYTAGSASGYECITDNTGILEEASSGEYVGIGMLNGMDRVIVAWYDMNKSRLVYSFRDVEDPYVPPANGDDANWAWVDKGSVPVEIDGAAPLYVDLAVDSDDGVHIAYYSSGEGGVKYAYLSPEKAKGSAALSTADFKTVSVDGYMSPGHLLKINVRKEERNGKNVQVPYISYYHNGFYGSANAARIAWLKDGISSTGEVANGLEGKKFTGNWIVMTVPAENNIRHYTICNGMPTSGMYGGKIIAAYFSSKRYEMAVLQK